MQQMAGAADVGEARARAAGVLRAFEQAVLQKAGHPLQVRVLSTCLTLHVTWMLIRNTGTGMLLSAFSAVESAADQHGESSGNC